MDAARLAGRLNLLGPWLRRAFAGPVVKIGLDAGLGCPHRQGGRGEGGCAFCPPGGAGRGAGQPAAAEQLARGLERLHKRAQEQGRPAPQALAYFQAYSSTHGPTERLRELYEQALAAPGVAGLIVSTRPDCLDGPRWDLLSELASRASLWLELGLQSAHDQTLKAMGRGHDVACFDAAAVEARRRGLRVVAHVVLGLPGEDEGHTNATARHLAGLGVWGVKLHNLMILEGSRLAQDWRAGRLRPWPRKRYAAAAGQFLARLPADTLVHRLAADPGPDRLWAPEWAADKARTLAALADYLEEHEIKQGSLT
ncbi:MAG: TIGR01212 family radical SAM protein [Thermodesulfobacteriota bacterium]